MSNQLTSLTTKQLRQAAVLKDKIEALNKTLATIIGGSTVVSVKKGGMSAAGRAKVAAAQKARWAKVKGAKPSVKQPAKTRKMSAEGRANIIAAQKARWTKINPEKK